MSKGGSANTAPSVSVQKTELPPWVEQGSQDVYNQMKGALAPGYQSYNGQTVSGTTADTNAAYDRIRGMQGQGDPAYASALNMATGLAGSAKTATPGDIEALRTQFQNPFQQDVINRSVSTLEDQATRAGNARAAQAGNVGAFGGSRYGVEQGIAAGETAKASGDLAGQLNLQGYNTSLQSALGLNQANQQLGLAGLQMMPQIAGARANQTALEAGMLQQIGTNQQQQKQNELNDTWRRWLEEKDYPVESAQMLGQTLSGLPFGSTNTTTTQQQGLKRNKLTGAASGAASGAALGSVVPGWGTAIGAGIGGLLGYFS
jgi:hypothetical protein